MAEVESMFTFSVFSKGMVVYGNTSHTYPTIELSARIGSIFCTSTD